MPYGVVSVCVPGVPAGSTRVFLEVTWLSVIIVVYRLPSVSPVADYIIIGHDTCLSHFIPQDGRARSIGSRRPPPDQPRSTHIDLPRRGQRRLPKKQPLHISVQGSHVESPLNYFERVEANTSIILVAMILFVLLLFADFLKAFRILAKLASSSRFSSASSSVPMFALMM